MDQLLSRMDPAILIPLSAIIMGCLTGMVIGIAKYWSRVRQTEIEVALKQDMLNRGMSAADIKHVLEATGHKPAWSQPDPLSPPDQVEVHRIEVQAKLKKDMLDRGLSPEQIEQVLRAGA